MLATCFDTLEDKRVQGRTKYELKYILLFSVFSFLSTGDSYRDIARFIKGKYPELKEAFGLDWESYPAYTTIRDMFLKLDIAALEGCLESHSKYILAQKQQEQLSLSAKGGAEEGATEVKQVCFDGKSLRKSGGADQKMKQILSVFSVQAELILCQEEISEKTNEIPVMQALLGRLGLTGLLVTADALHCQKKHSR
jgi:hypothetical protein